MISRRIPQTGSRLLRSRPRGSTTPGLFVVPHFLDFCFFCYSIAPALRQGRLQSARTTLRGLRRKNKNCPTYSPTPFLLHFEDDRSHLDQGARARRRESARKRGSYIIMMRSWNGRSGVAHGVDEQVGVFGRAHTSRHPSVFGKRLPDDKLSHLRVEKGKKLVLTALWHSSEEAVD